MELDRVIIEKAFTQMGALLYQQKKRGEIAVYGGTAILLQFDRTFATRDVDAVVTANDGPVIAAAHEVAKQLGLPQGWLNQGVSIYLSQHGSIKFHKNYPDDIRVGLTVHVAVPEYMLALKLQALRVGTRDYDDVIFLARETGLLTVENLLQLHQETFPGDPLEPRKIAVIHDLVRRIQET